MGGNMSQLLRRLLSADALQPRQSTWIGWQFDRPEKGEGMVQAFRRAESPYESIRAKLRGLEPEAVYTLTNVDISGTTEATGRELMDKGLSVVIDKRPGSAVILYKRKGD